ncbi:hypothetical protein NQ314_001917 [Rhamnusium bicolor]|uniref:Ku domain-containing protein n=1 Tax=Rhamnusium bicolor TaxID=1586634 RepID=A0AAV8ZTJ3_9CUCU|nr:hypothetical protein NQ314_001917 [Rhamnusium bicolor]
MPPASKREFGVILFDINSSNKEEALLTLIKICTYKWLSANKDTYKLILSNTKDSRNVKGFSNLYETNINELDPQPILECVENAEAEEGNWLDALQLAIHILKEAFEKPGIITLQILYITNLDRCSQTLDEGKVGKIIRDLKEYNIYLYIIGPNVKLPYTITSEDDVRDIMKDIKVDESIHSLAVAKKIIINTDNSVICDFKVGVHLFFSFKNSHGTQPWKVPLSFGTKLEIPVCTVKVYRKDAPFKLSSDVKNFSTVLVEDESVQLNYEDLVSGIIRHDKFVKVEGNDMFKVDGPRRDSTFYVLPDHEKPEECCQAIYNLVDVLAEQKKYAIARRVYNANTKPKFFVLVPQPDLEPKCFAMSELPYADEVNNKYKFVVPTASATESKNEDEFTQFFRSMDIWDDNCKVNIPLSPKLMLDWYSNKLVNAVAKQYLHRDLDLNEIDIDDLAETETNEFLDAFKKSWPEKTTNIDDENMD